MKRWLALVTFFLLFHKLDAQICNGSLGDPIINITFGAGPNPGAPLSAATTSYQYFNSDCPNDGFYALRNSTNSCFGNTWHSITDHTGNPNGYFMLVNASIQPSAFYLDTVKGLCGNTTYEFAAWILNILKPTSCGGAGIQPDLTFRIERTDGTVLQSYNTNNIPGTNTPEWKQFGFFFTTPASATDVVLRIVNNSQGGCGNDLALDDITFRPCGPQITTSITGTTATTVTSCEGTSKTYTFNSNLSIGFNNPLVQWQQRYNNGAWTDIPGAIFSSYTFNIASSAAAGIYAFRVAAAEAGNMNVPQCRIASTPLIVVIASNPPAAVSNNGPVCEGDTITLTSTGNSASWIGPNGFISNNPQVIIGNAQPIHSGRYYVTTVNGSCNRSDSINVIVNANPVITVSEEEMLLCDGDTVNVSVTGADTYSWSPATGLSSATSSEISIHAKDSMIYSVIGKLAGCSDTATIKVNVITKPVADAGSDKTIMEGNAVQLFGTVKGDSISYYWMPDVEITGVQTLSPVISPKMDTSYILLVVSNAGCGMAADTMHVHVYKRLNIPNAFSPNNDGVNDSWMIKGLDTYPKAVVTIFNRYGQPVFTTSNFSYWDGRSKGKRLPAGTYYYLVDLHNQFEPLAGWLELVY